MRIREEIPGRSVDQGVHPAVGLDRERYRGLRALSRSIFFFVKKAPEFARRNGNMMCQGPGL